MNEYTKPAVRELGKLKTVTLSSNSQGNNPNPNA